jgi:hypothetical protein
MPFLKVHARRSRYTHQQRASSLHSFEGILSGDSFSADVEGEGETQSAAGEFGNTQAFVVGKKPTRNRNFFD